MARLQLIRRPDDKLPLLTGKPHRDRRCKQAEDEPPFFHLTVGCDFSLEARTTGEDRAKYDQGRMMRLDSLH